MDIKYEEFLSKLKEGVIIHYWGGWEIVDSIEGGFVYTSKLDNKKASAIIHTTKLYEFVDKIIDNGELVYEKIIPEIRTVEYRVKEGELK